MNVKKIVHTQIIIVLASIISVAVLFGIDMVSAAPSQNPPNGNPSFPQGPQGPQGNQGPQGPQGPKGAKGQAGTNWYNNGVWVTNGWDGGCAFGAGIYFDTDGAGKTYNFIHFWNCSPGQGV